MGFPARWKPYAVVAVDRDRRSRRNVLGSELSAGVHRHLGNPLVGLLGFSAEGYLKTSFGRDLDGGMRLRGGSPLLHVQAGLDWSPRTGSLDPLLSLSLPVRRGGLLQNGGDLRLDWWPGRGDSFTVGLTIPLGQPWQGRTRPRAASVRLPWQPFADDVDYRPTSELAASLENVRHAARWIGELATPFFDHSYRTTEETLERLVGEIETYHRHLDRVDPAYPEGHSYGAEIDGYHRELERAVGLALRATGRRPTPQRVAELTGRLRRILLEDVLLPYNRLLGRRKTRDSLRGLSMPARNRLRRELDGEGLDDGSRDGLMFVFETLVNLVDSNRAQGARRWRDNRLVWLPLHYAVRPDEADTQPRLDALLELALNREFTDHNSVDYVLNEQFHLELIRTIRSTRHYHVLWIHDFRGLNEAGHLDRIGFQVTLEYLRALARGVRQHEAGGPLPTFLLFLDQHYYELHESDVWLRLLDRPLDHELILPPGYEDWQAELDAAREDLARAIASGSRLRRHLAETGDPDWIADRVRVHVSITHPPDFSFRSRHLIPNLPITPDNLMRDHRKIVFFDLTEQDPERGEAIYSGMGVGEHYTSPTWEDRAILARGPAPIHLKEAARQLLRSQGFRPEEIPHVLRPCPASVPPDRQLEGREPEFGIRALETHNQVGFGDKRANLVKALLYDLMPAGSQILVPDSLWNSPLWAGMLVGAALRGVRVAAIAPSRENMPGTGLAELSRANETFVRLLAVREKLGPHIERAGGDLMVGIYDIDFDVSDVRAQVEAFREGVAAEEEFREAFPFTTSVYDAIAAVPDVLDQNGIGRSPVVADSVPRKPKLHMKAQLFVSAEARRLLDDPAWLGVVEAYLVALARQAASTDSLREAEEIRDALQEPARFLGEALRRRVAPDRRDRVMLYLTVGSHNQDHRSTIMDGETLFVTSGTGALIAHMDFMMLMATTTWIETVEELEALVPPVEGLFRLFARYFRHAL